MMKSINWRRGGVIIFLVLLVLGFSIPGFLDLDGNTPQTVAPRLCQTDNECILVCETPVNVLCSQNLCQQNSCGEFAAVPYAEKPKRLWLKIIVQGQEMNFSTRTGDSFVEVNGNQVQIFSMEMSLPQALEKLGVRIGECLSIKNSNYCPDQAHALQLRINGNESVQQYFPQDGDVVEIIYS